MSGSTTGSAGTGDTELECGKVREEGYDTNAPEELEGYSEIGGRVGICCTELEDLRILGCLERVGGLRLVWNDSLESLDGLERLKHVDWSITIEDRVENVAALRGLTSLDHDLQINSPNLTSLHGLEGLTRVGGELRITSSAVLPDLQGLNALEEVGKFRVYGLPALIDLSGLDSLRRINFFGVAYNDAMSSLDGLDGVTHFGERFDLYENPSLTDITGALGGKVDVDGRIYIVGNKQLPACEAERLAASLQPPGHTGYVMVSDNLGVCP